MTRIMRGAERQIGIIENGEEDRVGMEKISEWGVEKISR